MVRLMSSSVTRVPESPLPWISSAAISSAHMPNARLSFHKDPTQILEANIGSIQRSNGIARPPPTILCARKITATPFSREVPMDDGWRTGMQVTGKKNIRIYPINKDGRNVFVCCIYCLAEDCHVLCILLSSRGVLKLFRGVSRHTGMLEWSSEKLHVDTPIQDISIKHSKIVRLGSKGEFA
ncbi:hypothetical protein PR048_016893 [Dryococelus australis]|uniref:Uncharacterized protein n=1 Tax=Dryococelus australis TaxID=614101 RepID=A0ABQ9H823_9NEOP|nr:hypothetical protein PR048_016893 [Dryococelus australis]